MQKMKLGAIHGCQGDGVQAMLHSAVTSRRAEHLCDVDSVLCFFIAAD